MHLTNLKDYSVPKTTDTSVFTRNFYTILCNVKASLKGKVSLGTEFYFVQILKSKLSDRKIIIVFKLKGDFKKS